MADTKGSFHLRVSPLFAVGMSCDWNPGFTVTISNDKLKSDVIIFIYQEVNLSE